jgi:hypothetical protein
MILLSVSVGEFVAGVVRISIYAVAQISIFE